MVDGEAGADNCPRSLIEAWGAMNDRGSWLLLRATLFWLLSAGGCALVAVQHYHLYKDAAMRHCAFEAL